MSLRVEDASKLPPLPPPVSPILVQSVVKINQADDDLENESTIKIQQCLQLENLIYLQKRITDTYSDTVYKCFQPVRPIKQVGPTCGMASLATAMAEQLITVEKLVEIAKSNKWSNYGEMFSCAWMTELASLVGARSRCISGGLLNHMQCIVSSLSKQGFVLVPYDKDRNHAPTTREGQSAHWALITGLVILKCPPTSLNYEIDLNPCSCESVEWLPADEIQCKRFVLAGIHPPASVVISDNKIKVSSEADVSNEDPVRIYVCAYQGLSRNLYLWDLIDLAESNLNLLKVDTKRDGSVLLPEGGISAGLSGRAVVLYKS